MTTSSTPLTGHTPFQGAWQTEDRSLKPVSPWPTDLRELSIAWLDRSPISRLWRPVLYLQRAPVNNVWIILYVTGGSGSGSNTIPVDYNLYRKFWSLQDFFRRPAQCYEKFAWKTFINVRHWSWLHVCVCVCLLMALLSRFFCCLYTSVYSFSNVNPR